MGETERLSFGVFERNESLLSTGNLFRIFDSMLEAFDVVNSVLTKGGGVADELITCEKGKLSERGDVDRKVGKERDFVSLKTFSSFIRIGKDV